MTKPEMQSSISNNPIAMVLSDPNLPDNPLVFVNQAFEKLTLYNGEAAVGQNCRFLQCDESDQDTIDKMREAIDAGRDVTADIVNRRADGTTFLNRVVIAPLRSETGELQAFLGILNEIPDDDGGERAEIDHESRQMLRELQHRVKNHLAMVVSLIRLQSRSEVTRESFEALSHRVQSLALLYEELSSAGVVDTTAETLPAGAYLSRVASTIAALDGRASIRINIACDEVELPVDTGARLGMILTELITNAFEHAFRDRERGVIHVRFTRQTGGKLRLTVEDDGIGMPEENDWPNNAPSVPKQIAQTEAAEGDQQVLDTRAGKRKSGVGGSIVSAMVQFLEGDLSITSTEHGTVVRLDIAEAEAETE